MTRVLLSLARHVIQWIQFVQRLPMAIGFLLGLVLVWPCYKLFSMHKLLLRYVQFWVRLYFVLNGVRLRYDAEMLAQFEGDVVITHYFSPTDYAILFLIFPYKKLLLLDPVFFEQNFLKQFFYYLGFYPSNHHVSIHQFQKQTFHEEAYMSSGFTILEAVEFRSQPYEMVPYALLLAHKQNKTIHFIELDGAETLRFSTFWTPKKVSIKLIETVMPDKRIEKLLLQYERIVQTYRGIDLHRQPETDFRVQAAPL